MISRVISNVLQAALAALILSAVPAISARGPEDPLDGYSRLDLDCGPYSVYYDEGRERLAGEIGSIVCRSAAEIADGLGLEYPSGLRIAVASSSGEFESLHHGMLPEWGEAFSDRSRMLIGIDAARALRTERPLDEVVRHELSHLFLDMRTGGVQCPFWFAEGVAMRQSGEWTLSMQWRLALSVWRKDMPDLAELEGPFPRSGERASMAYLLSFTAVDRLLEGRERRLATLTAFIRETGDFERAFLLTFGETADEFAARITADLESRYRKTAVLLHSSPYWLSLAGLFLLVYALKRRRSRMKLARWEAEEAESGPAPADEGSQGGGRPRRYRRRPR